MTEEELENAIDEIIRKSGFAAGQIVSVLDSMLLRYEDEAAEEP